MAGTSAGKSAWIRGRPSLRDRQDRWDAGTVGFVERGDRNVTLSELLGLMLVLGKTFGELVDPTGPDGSVGTYVDIGFPEGPLGPAPVRDWLKGRVQFRITEYEPEMKIATYFLDPDEQERYLERFLRPAPQEER